jgi:predicted MFS family arabinose efflux permease
MTTIRLPFLFLIAFLVGADEFLLGPILTPIGDDLEVAPERVTLFITAYALPLALLAPIFGFLSDRYGRLAVLLPSTAGFAAASALTGFAGSFEWGLATRVLTGIASAGMLPIAFALAADEGEEGAAKGIAFVMSGLTLGIVVSPGFGSLVTEAWSWRGAFLTIGVLAMLTAFFALIVMRSGETVPSARWSAEGSGIWVPGAAGALCGMFFGIGGAVGIYSLVGERLRDALHLDTYQVGLIYVGFGIFSVIGNALAPAMIRRTGGRQAMRLCGGAILLCITLVFGLPDPGLAMVCTTLGVWALLGGIGAPGLQAHIAGLSVSRRGVLMALGTSALNLGVAFSAALAGEAYLHSSLWVAALGAVLLAIAVAALAKRRGPEMTWNSTA